MAATEAGKPESVPRRRAGKGKLKQSELVFTPRTADAPPAAQDEPRAASTTRSKGSASPASAATVAPPSVTAAPPAAAAPPSGTTAPPAAVSPTSDTTAPPTAAAPAAANRQPDLLLQAGLQKTQRGLWGRINQLLGRSTGIDAQLLEELEEVLLTADVGVALSMRLIDDLRAQPKALHSAADVRQRLRAGLTAALQAAPAGLPLEQVERRPKVVLFVGVNGVGKTTSIGKLAHQLRQQGRSVLLAAGDTFRAAAAEQLEIWAERSGAQLCRGAAGADPASVIFQAVQQAVQADIDVVLADTAGRLHTKVELMDEIKKIRRAAGKARPEAPDETWLVVDATTGQNALQQAREFHQALGLTGIVLTKLDGTAKGGVVVAMVEAIGAPVRFIGVGERAEDLRPFDANSFVAALFAPAAAEAA